MGLDIVQISIIVTAIAAIFAGIFTIIKYSKRFIEWIFKKRGSGPDRQPNDESTHKLLRYFWQYPTLNKSDHFSEKCWAVKESQVLKGNLGPARENPGLGAAVFSFDLALNVFGSGASESRITTAIEWARGRTERVKRESTPFQFQGKEFLPYIYVDQSFNPIDSRVKKVKDFRHTLAYAILLAMSGRLESIVKEYVFLTVESQLSEGNWNAGDGVTPSELMTVLYAVIFLGIYSERRGASMAIDSSICNARKSGIDWILKHRDGNGLWKTGILGDKQWDTALGTAWVLRGMSLLNDDFEEDWKNAAGKAIARLASLVFASSTWEGTSDLQRYRVEARIAAALNRSKSAWLESSGARDQVREYLRGWRKRAEAEVRKMDESEWDLATVTFSLDSLYSYDELKLVAIDILKEESAGRVDE